MDSNTMTVRIIQSILLSIVTMVCFGVANCSYQDSLISKDIRAGVDPIAVRCAHSGNESASCAVLVAKRSEGK